MFGKCGIDFGPEAHKGFSEREWKLAREFFDLMLHLPLPEDEDEWDSFFDWALSGVFDVDENTDQEAALKALRICYGSWSGSPHKIFLLRWGRTHDKREKLC